MARKTDATSEQIAELEGPVTLTPDQIAEAAGGAAAAALFKLCCPIIFGGILDPTVPLLADPAPVTAV